MKSKKNIKRKKKSLKNLNLRKRVHDIISNEIKNARRRARYYSQKKMRETCQDLIKEAEKEKELLKNKLSELNKELK